jgi:hypothetical protein
LASASRQVALADPLAVAGVDLGGAVGHLDQQPAVTAQQQRKGGMRGDEMGVHPHRQHPQATGEVVLPHRRVPLGVAVAAEDVVDQDVQAAVLGLDLGDQAGYGRGVLVVDDQGCAAPADGGYQVAGLLYRLRPPDLRPSRRPAAAPGGVDVQPGPGQLDRDGTSRPPRRSRHQRDPLAVVLGVHGDHESTTSRRICSGNQSARREPVSRRTTDVLDHPDDPTGSSCSSL